MKNKWGLVFFVSALALAFVAALLSVSVIQGFNKTVQVIVPANDIAAYTLLTADLFVAKSVPAAAVNEHTITRMDSILGQRAKGYLVKGQIVTTNHLVSQLGGSVTAAVSNADRVDLRAVSVAVNEISGYGGKLAIHDRVDFVLPGSEGEEQLITNVPVIDLIQDNNGKLTGIIVEVTERYAYMLAQQETIKIVVRPQT